MEQKQINQKGDNAIVGGIMAICCICLIIGYANYLFTEISKLLIR